MMLHDDQCELKETRFTPWGIRAAECHCGSRAYPLCDGCRSNQHLKHRPVDGERVCACDLCSEEAA